MKQTPGQRPFKRRTRRTDRYPLQKRGIGFCNRRHTDSDDYVPDQRKSRMERQPCASVYRRGRKIVLQI